MANKRKLEEAGLVGLDELTATGPPNKKQRISDHSLEKENDHKIKLKLITKLGNSDKLFQVKDLQMFTYFSNQLSGRWSNDDISINGEDLCFGMDQIEALIYYKKHNAIHIRYPYSELIYLCNAFDYLTENVSSQVFETYFTECIPSIKFQNLFEFKSLSTTKCCKVLATAVDEALSQILIKQNRIQNQTIENWRYVPIKVLTCNARIAVAVFVNNFVFNRNSFSFQNKSDRLSALWKYICEQKLYLKYPTIINAIYELKHEKKGIGFGSSNSNSVISQIVCDTLGICYQNNLKYSRNDKCTLILNVFNVIRIVGYFSESEIKSLKQEEFCHYDFLFIILKKLIHLRANDIDQYQVHFGANFIAKLLNETFPSIALMSGYRDIFKSIEELGVDEKFSNKEKYNLYLLLFRNRMMFGLTNELLTNVLGSLVDITMESPEKSYITLKFILNEYKHIHIKQSILHPLIKSLIEIDHTQSFKLTKKWFPLFMKDSNWITKELPTKTSYKTLSILIDGICEYITTLDHKPNSVDLLYLDFINQYTNAWCV